MNQASAYVHCSGSEALSPTATKTGYWITFARAYFSTLEDLANPLQFLPTSLADLMAALETHLQVWTNDALVPVPPYPVADASTISGWLSTATIGCITLGNAQYLQIDAALKAITDQVSLTVTRIERVDASAIETPQRAVTLDTVNTAAAAANVAASPTARFFGALTSYARWGLGLAALLALGLVLTRRRAD